MNLGTRDQIGTVLAVSALALAACSTTKPDPIPVQPSAPTSANIVDTVGKQLDKIDGRVAAAITAARESADKPEVVKAETGVALSYLPAPSPSDLNYARGRVARSDAKEYAEAQEYGRKLLAKIDADWVRIEQQTAEAKRVSDLKDARLTAQGQEIDRLTKEVARVEAEASRNVWTLTGAGLALAGAAASAFLGFRTGGVLLACAAFCGAMPFVYGSSYFPWVAGVTLSAAAGLGLWRLADHIRDLNAAKDGASSPDGPPTP